MMKDQEIIDQVNSLFAQYKLPPNCSWAMSVKEKLIKKFSK